MNLSGIIFHIEEDAYDKLNKYLSTIKGYFKDSEGCDEIMSDIEARIAEMLQGKVSSIKQAILMQDVQSMIAIMGKPEDFAGESENIKNDTESSNHKRENKESYSNNKRRRIFRDPDDKIFAGVCSGIANYFDIDPIWLRAAFAISFFVFGSGLLLYIILMIIIPKAKTTAEKLEMRGEKVDINNIGKAVNEEFEEFKTRMKDFGDEVKSPENKRRLKSALQNALDFIGEILQSILKVLAKIVAFVFIFIGILLLIGLLAAIFGWGTISIFGTSDAAMHFSLYELSSAFLPNDLPIQYVVIGLILFLGIPLVSMIYGGINYLSGIKQKNKFVKYTANVLWLCGLVLILYIGLKVGSDFSEQASTKQNINIIQPKGNILYLNLKPMPEDDLDVGYAKHHNIRLGDWTMISKGEDKFRLGYPTLNIVVSPSDSFELITIKSAQGFNKKEAVNRAKDIDYTVNQMDSTLELNSYFDIKTTDKLRAQNVKLVLKVPVNKILFLNKSMEKIIFDIDNVNDALDNDMVNRKWIMTKQGLECIDCEGVDNIHKQ